MKALQVLVYSGQIVLRDTPSGERSNSTKTEFLTSIAQSLSLSLVSKRRSGGRRCYNSSAWMAAD
jgi:hypothetical protein